MKRLVNGNVFVKYMNDEVAVEWVFFCIMSDKGRNMVENRLYAQNKLLGNRRQYFSFLSIVIVEKFDTVRFNNTTFV